MVRRDRADNSASVLRRSSPAGVSPASVSAGAPSSRPQASRESVVARAGCHKPPRREQARGPQPNVKPAASTDSQSESRAAHVTAKAMSTASKSGGRRAADLGGVRGAARVHGEPRNSRGPSAQPGSGRRDAYKPTVKVRAGQRESEGVVVPGIAATNNAASPCSFSLRISATQSPTRPCISTDGWQRTWVTPSCSPSVVNTVAWARRD